MPARLTLENIKCIMIRARTDSVCLNFTPRLLILTILVILHTVGDDAATQPSLIVLTVFISFSRE